MKIINNIGISLLLILSLLHTSCEEKDVFFSSTANTFESIQIQKFNYGTNAGTGDIYQGRYSPQKDSIYFDVTYFPDQTAPTYQDWQLTSTLASGARVAPAMAGVKDLSSPLRYTITAPDGKSTKDVVVVTRIFEIPFGELDHGFGRTNKLWEKTAVELGGWGAHIQTAIAVVGDELIVNNGKGDLLVYDKRTGAKLNKTVPAPAGLGGSIMAIAADAMGVLHAVAYMDANDKTQTFKVYRWKNGLNQQPEVFYALATTAIPTTKGTGMGRSLSIAGNTSGAAQMMVALDGVGTAEDRIMRISVEGGVPVATPDIFASGSGVSWTWRGKGIAVSPTGRIPYIANSLGNPPGMAYYDNSGNYNFITSPANSNFLNKTIICCSYYFEFNHAKYLVTGSVSWPGALRMLVFCLDDPTLIPSGKDNSVNYDKLNPLSVNWDLMETDNGNGTADVTVQVQPDGKTALVYMLDTNNGILAYELTNMGTSSK